MLWHNYPHVRQKNMRDCGIAALRMIAAYYQREVDPKYLRHATRIDRIGTSFATLKHAAGLYGFEAEGVMVRDLDDLDLFGEGPSILLFDNNHFVVFYEKKRGKYIIGDPADGLVKMKAEDLRKRLFVRPPGTSSPPIGYALLFSPGTPAAPPPLPQGEALRENQQWAFLRENLHQLRPFFLVILLGIAVTSVLQYLLPYITKSVVDLGIGTGDLDFVKYLLIGQLFLILSKTGFNILRSWIVLHLSLRINYKLIAGFLQKLFRLPLPFFETRRIGDILQRISDHHRIETFITRNSLSIVVAVLTVLIYSFILFNFHAFFFGMFAVAAVAYLVWTLLFLRARKHIDLERFRFASNDQSILIQLINGMHDLKINNSQQFYFEKWKANQMDSFRNTFSYLRVNQVQDTGTMLIVELTQLSILFLSASLIVSNEISLGTMLSIQFITGQLIAPMDQIMQGIVRGQEAQISLGRITEFWDERDESSYNQGQKIAPRPAPGSTISLRDLTFTHPGQVAKPALQEINLDIPLGKSVAIVGSSGSGKTTLLKLLLGYYLAYQGEMTVDGHNFRALDVNAWRDRCGVILQESFIFNESIRGNIVLGGDFEERRFEMAKRITNLDEFVDDMPQGYHTPIGRDGKGLSMGQKQRILMARAIYKDPEFVFMDEATNALDADNEAFIMEGLQQFFRGRTTIVVAHRLSTIQFADKIVVLHKGRVVEEGSHAELLARRGRYYELVKKQMQ